MLLIDDEFRKYLGMAVDDCGGLVEYGKKLDVSHTTVMNWKNGNTKRVKNTIFMKILETLKPYLSQDEYDKYFLRLGDSVFDSFHAYIKERDKKQKKEIAVEHEKKNSHPATTGYQTEIESFSDPACSVSAQAEHDVFLHEILSVWPKLSRSGKMKVATFAVELLEKSGAGASEDDLGKDRAKHA